LEEDECISCTCKKGKKSSDIYAECINTCACDPEKIKAQYDRKVEELENQNANYEQQVQDHQDLLEEAERKLEEAKNKDDDNIIDEALDVVDDVIDGAIDKVEDVVESVWSWFG